MPNVPTSAQSGLPGFEAVQYYGLAAPAGTPDDYAANILREEGKWAALVKKLGLKIE